MERLSDLTQITQVITKYLGFLLQHWGGFMPLCVGNGQGCDVSRCTGLVPLWMFTPCKGGSQIDFAVHERWLRVAKFSGHCSVLQHWTQCNFSLLLGTLSTDGGQPSVSQSLTVHVPGNPSGLGKVRRLITLPLGTLFPTPMMRCPRVQS